MGNGTAGDIFRLGFLMEFVPGNLRVRKINFILISSNIFGKDALRKDARLKSREIQLNMARQIASGMNFLHSLNPPILHRDLRTPNILLTDSLVCKISDFGSAYNEAYQAGPDQLLIYARLVPPECKQNQPQFSKKGDVYVIL